MGTWQVQEAKAKFSEVLQDAESKGPQRITRRGVAKAVVVSIEEWERIKRDAENKPVGEMTMLELLQSGPRGDFPLPDRHAMRMRKVEPL